jgi:phosphatidylinositol alpha-1,6-mannosyltransferase
MQSAGGSRLRLLAKVHAAAFPCGHFIYDSCNMAQSHPFLPGLRRRHLTFINGIEVWENAKPRWIRSARRSSMLVSISRFTRDRADSIHGGFSRAVVCALATMDDEEAPDLPTIELSRAATPPSVLIVGRMDANEDYKGHRELIECWPHILREIPNAILHIVGRGNAMPEYQRMAERLSLCDSVRFHGFVSVDTLNSLYATSKVFAMPSRGEGFGLVYIEAMRYGLPVIASRHDAGQEIVLHEKTGLTVDMNRPDELPAAVVRLLRHPEEAVCFGRAGLQRWREEYTYARFRDRFRAILHQFLERKH